MCPPPPFFFLTQNFTKFNAILIQFGYDAVAFTNGMEILSVCTPLDDRKAGYCR
jgi:hypothetical protein